MEEGEGNSPEVSESPGLKLLKEWVDPQRGVSLYGALGQNAYQDLLERMRNASKKKDQRRYTARVYGITKKDLKKLKKMSGETTVTGRIPDCYRCDDTGEISGDEWVEEALGPPILVSGPNKPCPACNASEEEDQEEDL